MQYSQIALGQAILARLKAQVGLEVAAQIPDFPELTDKLGRVVASYFEVDLLDQLQKEDFPQLWATLMKLHITTGAVLRCFSEEELRSSSVLGIGNGGHSSRLEEIHNYLSERGQILRPIHVRRYDWIKELSVDPHILPMVLVRVSLRRDLSIDTFAKSLNVHYLGDLEGYTREEVFTSLNERHPHEPWEENILLLSVMLRYFGMKFFDP